MHKELCLEIFSKNEILLNIANKSYWNGNNEIYTEYTRIEGLEIFMDYYYYCYLFTVVFLKRYFSIEILKKVGAGSIFKLPCHFGFSTYTAKCRVHRQHRTHENCL